MTREVAWSNLLLEYMRTDKIMPFVGAGFSLNVPGDFLSFKDLAEKLKDDLGPRYTDLADPLDITDAYEKESSIDDLHEAICSYLPSEDLPGECHELLMSFHWRRVYTTNYDTLLENAGSGDCCTVVDNQEYFQNFGAATTIVKLCGDRTHKHLMRATRERLDARHIRKTCRLLYDDLVHYLQRGRFLFLGYSLNDPFMKTVRGIVDMALAEIDDGLTRRKSYIITFDLSEEEKNKLEHEHNLIAVNLDTSGRSKREAVLEFLQAAAEFREQQSKRKKLRIFPGPQIRRMERRLKEAWTVPVFTTSGRFSKDVVCELLEPILEAKGRELQVFTDQDLPKDEGQLDDLMESAVCAVFVFDLGSSILEGIVERSFLLDCQAIVLCTEENHLGRFSSHLKYVRVDHPDVKVFVENELLIASTNGRFALCEEYLRLVDCASCVIHSWIAVEQYLQYAGPAFKGSRHKKGNESASIWRDIKSIKQSGGLKNIDLDQFNRLREIRNAVEHRGRIPLRTEAEETLAFTKKLIRSLSFDLPLFLSKLKTFGKVLDETAGKTNDESRTKETG